MAKGWSREENEIFVKLMPDYRKAAENQSMEQLKQITEQYVSDLLSHPLLSQRSRQAIYEHLTYFDDLLEGIGTTQNYGAKDSIYFGKLKSGTRTTQHPLRVLRNRSYYLNPPSPPWKEERTSGEGGSDHEDYIWINIDIPEKSCTVHSDPNCIYVVQKKESPFKGIETLRRDGGWLRFENMEDVTRFCLDQYLQFKRIDHC